MTRPVALAAGPRNPPSWRVLLGDAPARDIDTLDGWVDQRSTRCVDLSVASVPTVSFR